MGRRPMKNACFSGIRWRQRPTLSGSRAAVCSVATRWPAGRNTPPPKWWSWTKGGKVNIFAQCCGSASGSRCFFDPWIRDPDPGWWSESLKTVFKVKKINSLMQFRIRNIFDPRSGINIPDYDKGWKLRYHETKSQWCTNQVLHVLENLPVSHWFYCLYFVKRTFETGCESKIWHRSVPM